MATTTPANASDTYKQQVATIAGAANVLNHGLVGDGITDNLAAWNTLIASEVNVYFPPGDYLFSEPMDIPRFRTVTGSGMCHDGDDGTNIIGTSGQSAAVTIETGAGVDGNVYFSNFTLSGDSDAGLYVNGAIEIVVDRIKLKDSTFVTGFHFETTFGCTYSNLFTNGSGVTDTSFYCGTNFNANMCSNWYTASTFETYGIMVDGGHGSQFNMMTLQGQNYGLFVKTGYSHTFNTVYSESVVVPVRLGDLTESGPVNNITLNGVECGGPGAHPDAADAIAGVELEWCHATRITGLYTSGTFGNKTSAPVTITGDGSGAKAYVRVLKDGTLHSIEVITPGSGYTSASASFGGAGSSAAATVQVSGGEVTGLTITNAGSGYTPAGTPLAIRIAKGSQTVIDGLYVNDGWGLNTSPYPWIAHHPTSFNTVDLTLLNLKTNFKTSGSLPSKMMKVDGGYKHMLTYYDGDGTENKKFYTLPEFP